MCKKIEPNLTFNSIIYASFGSNYNFRVALFYEYIYIILSFQYYQQFR